MKSSKYDWDMLIKTKDDKEVLLSELGIIWITCNFCDEVKRIWDYQRHLIEKHDWKVIIGTSS